MNVLVFAPHSAVWIHAFPEALVAEALMQEGHQIIYVGCGGVLKINAKSTGHELYTAYKDWAQQTNEWEMNERKFSTALTEREGITKKRHGSGIVWKGIAVLPCDQGCESPPSGNY